MITWFKCLSPGGQIPSVAVAMMIKNPRRGFCIVCGLYSWYWKVNSIKCGGLFEYEIFLVIARRRAEQTFAVKKYKVGLFYFFFPLSLWNLAVRQQRIVLSEFRHEEKGYVCVSVCAWRKETARRAVCRAGKHQLLTSATSYYLGLLKWCATHLEAWIRPFPATWVQLLRLPQPASETIHNTSASTNHAEHAFKQSFKESIAEGGCSIWNQKSLLLNDAGCGFTMGQRSFAHSGLDGGHACAPRDVCRLCCGSMEVRTGFSCGCCYRLEIAKAELKPMGVYVQHPIVRFVKSDACCWL